MTLILQVTSAQKSHKIETTLLPRGERFFCFCLAADWIWAPMLHDQGFDSCSRRIGDFGILGVAVKPYPQPQRGVLWLGSLAWLRL